MGQSKRVSSLTSVEINLIKEKVSETLGVDPDERNFDIFDVMNYIAKTERYEKALREIMLSNSPDKREIARKALEL